MIGEMVFLIKRLDEGGIPELCGRLLCPEEKFVEPCDGPIDG